MILKQVAGFCHQMKKTSLLIHLIYQLFDYNSNFSAPSAKSLFSLNSQNFPITIPFSIHPNYFTLFYQFFVSHHTSRLVNIFPNGHQKCQYELHFPCLNNHGVMHSSQLCKDNPKDALNMGFFYCLAQHKNMIPSRDSQQAE